MYDNHENLFNVALFVASDCLLACLFVCFAVVSCLDHFDVGVTGGE